MHERKEEKEKCEVNCAPLNDYELAAVEKVQDLVGSLTEPLTIDAMRHRAWWRAVRRYALTPAEQSLLIIDGDRDRVRRRPDQTDDTGDATDRT